MTERNFVVPIWDSTHIPNFIFLVDTTGLTIVDDVDVRVISFSYNSYFYCKYFDIAIPQGKTRGLLIVVAQNTDVVQFRKLGLVITNSKYEISPEDVNIAIQAMTVDESSLQNIGRSEDGPGPDPLEVPENLPLPDDAPRQPNHDNDEPESDEDRAMREFITRKVFEFLRSDVDTEQDCMESYLSETYISLLDRDIQPFVRVLREERAYEKSLRVNKRRRGIHTYPFSNTHRDDKKREKFVEELSEVDNRLLRHLIRVLLHPKKVIKRALRLGIRIAETETVRYILSSVLHKIQRAREQEILIFNIKDWTFFNELWEWIKTMDNDLTEAATMHVINLIVILMMDYYLDYIPEPVPIIEEEDEM